MLRDLFVGWLVYRLCKMLLFEEAARKRNWFSYFRFWFEQFGSSFLRTWCENFRVNRFLPAGDRGSGILGASGSKVDYFYVYCLKGWGNGAFLVYFLSKFYFVRN